jgi:acetyl/propionyl-CoA carboxylase alpha subunit
MMLHNYYMHVWPAMQEEAGRVGYPLLVKAVMGGGGKGMKLATDPSHFLVRASRARA